MRRSLIVGSIILANLILLSGCSSMKVQSDWRDDVKFGQYRTFTLIQPEESGIADPLIRRRVEDAIRAELTERGFAESIAEPDFWVAFHVRVADKVSVDSYGYGYGYHPYGPYGGWGGWHTGPAYVDVHHYQEGSLIIDFVDAAEEEAFWRGWATGTLDGKGRDPAAIREVVYKILAQYPPSG